MYFTYAKIDEKIDGFASARCECDYLLWLLAPNEPEEQRRFRTFVSEFPVRARGAPGKMHFRITVARSYRYLRFISQVPTFLFKYKWFSFWFSITTKANDFRFSLPAPSPTYWWFLDPCRAPAPISSGGGGVLILFFF